MCSRFLRVSQHQSRRLTNGCWIVASPSKKEAPRAKLSRDQRLSLQWRVLCYFCDNFVPEGCLILKGRVFTISVCVTKVCVMLSHFCSITRVYRVSSFIVSKFTTMGCLRECHKASPRKQIFEQCAFARSSTIYTVHNWLKSLASLQHQRVEVNTRCEYYDRSLTRTEIALLRYKYSSTLAKDG